MEESSKKIYGVAIIGCGVMGEAHFEDIHCLDNVEIRCACDLDINRALKMKKKYNVDRAESDYKKVIASDDVDIVVIATYPSSHLAILEEAIKHKKHVLCEKPLADTMEGSEKMVNLIKDNPETKVLIGYILRHNKTYQKVAEMIRSGAIGFPIVMRMTQNHHTMDWSKYLKLICDTSPIIDCGVHYLDVMHWFTGASVTSVSGIGLRTEEDVPEDKYNYGIMTVKMSDGSIGYYEAGWGNTMPSDNLKEFIGPKGRIKIVYQMYRPEHQEEGDLIEYYKYPEKCYETINVNCKRKPTGDQLEELIKMIETGKIAQPSIEDVWSSYSMAYKADMIIREGLNSD